MFVYTYFHRTSQIGESMLGPAEIDPTWIPGIFSAFISLFLWTLGYNRNQLFLKKKKKERSTNLGWLGGPIL